MVEKNWKEPREVTSAMEALESAENLMIALSKHETPSIIDDEEVHAAITELQQKTYRACAEIVRDYRRALQ